MLTGTGSVTLPPLHFEIPQWLHDSRFRRLPNVTAATHPLLQIPFEPYDLMVRRDGSNRAQSSDCGCF